MDPRSTTLPLLLLPLLATLAGCGDARETRACMGGTTPSSLVSSAALFRLEVYSADVTCAGSRVAAGAGLPLVSHVYTRDEPIALDVTPGNHAIVLTTYADVAATEPLGQGCVMADLAPGSEICFDLTLDPYNGPPADLAAPSDGGVPSDLAGPPDLAPVMCTHITGDFIAGAPAAPWTLENSAFYASSTGVILNDAVKTLGGLFFATAVGTSAFDATFSYRITGPDGIALVLAAQAAGFAQNTTSGAGGGMGYVGMQGYAFELDTWQNSNDPNNNHVGYAHAFDGSHIVTGTPQLALDCGGCLRTAHIRFSQTHLLFEVDGVAAFDGDLPATGPDAFIPGGYYFGFTASTGNLVGGQGTYLHSLSNVDIIVGPAGACY
jgi:hypothetical protein